MQGQSGQLENALRQIEQAEQQMREGSSGNPDAARRASESLRAAGESIQGAERKQASEQLNDMSRKASQLAEAHKNLTERMRREFAGGEKAQHDPRFGPSSSRATPEARRLADDEEKLAAQLKSLEQQMAETARNLTGGQPDASSKLREALGQAQEDDLEMRMRKSADFMRKGEGMYSWMREGTTSQGLQKLKEQIQQAQGSLRQNDDKGDGKGAGPNDETKKALEAALGQAEQMRKQLEQLGNGKGGKQQPGGKSGTDPGRSHMLGAEPEGQAGNQPGTRPGQPGNAPTPGEVQSTQMEMQRGASRLRQLTQGQSEIGIGNDLDQLNGILRQLNSSGDPGELAARLNRELLPEIERIEVELRRKLDIRLAENVRTATPENAPEGYADAVAEYFRRLSKAK
jgi:hypothetical protein